MMMNPVSQFEYELEYYGKYVDSRTSIEMFVDSFIGKGVRIVWPIGKALYFQNVYAPAILGYLEKHKGLYVNCRRDIMQISFDLVNAGNGDRATYIDFVYPSRRGEDLDGRKWDLVAPIDWGGFDASDYLAYWMDLVRTRIAGAAVIKDFEDE